MGNSTSKATRTLNKSIQRTHQSLDSTNIKNLKKQVTNDHLTGSTKRNFKSNENDEPQIFTQRPPKELEKMGDDEKSNFNDKFGNKLFEEIVSKGVVNIKDSAAKQNFNPNHESIQLLKNRLNVEKQYEGLVIPKDADKPNIPDRFLSEEQKKDMKDPAIMRRKLEKTGVNLFGLFDSNKISDLIGDYKVYGEEAYIEKAKKIDVNDENIRILKKFIDEGIIDLPTHKVTLQESIDPESRQVKQKLVVVNDDWVGEIKEDIEREKMDKSDSKSKSKRDLEVFEQFKMLENLVSKSQITTKKSEGPTDEVETVMKRPKKQLVKEVTKIL